MILVHQTASSLMNTPTNNATWSADEASSQNVLATLNLPGLAGDEGERRSQEGNYSSSDLQEDDLAFEAYGY